MTKTFDRKNGSIFLTKPLTIRAATPDDLSDLSQIICECLEHYFGSSDGGEKAASRVLGDVPGSVETAIAYLNGNSVGFATFAVVYPGPNGRGTLFMKDLFVSGAARSQNLGRRLMTYLANVACERDCVRFDWTAETSNPRALSFYDDLGASRVTDKVYFRLEGDRLTGLSKES